MLENYGLCEFINFIDSELIGRKLVAVYGNCHMKLLSEYLMNNCFFSAKYVIRYHYIGEKDAPLKNELEKCSIFIAQDIRESNDFGMPSAEVLGKQCSDIAKNIIVPNLYGCNLFFPQCYFPKDGIEEKHLGAESFDIRDRDEISRQRIRVTVNSIGKRDSVIDEMIRNGASLTEIQHAILNRDVFDKKMIIENFNSELKKLKQRENFCNIKISDYIEKRYREEQLFYEPFHPCENIISEKGRRILKLINIPVDEAIPIRKEMSAMEMPIYECVRKTLGFRYKRNEYMRRYSNSTLGNKPETLEEYIENYVKWVWNR